MNSLTVNLIQNIFLEPQPFTAGRHLCGALEAEDVGDGGQHGEHRVQAQHRLLRDPRPQGLHQPDPQDPGGPDQGPEGLLHGQGLLPGDA